VGEGKTRGHYLKQKEQAFVRFQVNCGERTEIFGSQFTLYDFVSNSFSFSFKKKKLAVQVLESLKKQPKDFLELVEELKEGKSTLYLLCLSLERAGLIEKNGRGVPYHLSKNFSAALQDYAEWWSKWVGQETP
jgi:predicted transcriptional regulator